MKKQEQILAIAKACGWNPRVITYNAGTAWAVVSDDIRAIPGYLNDLNAMHEAEQMLWPLTDSLNDNWSVYLGWIESLSGHGGCSENQQAFRMIQATAEQRAEAFLRTLNLWTD